MTNLGLTELSLHDSLRLEVLNECLGLGLTGKYKVFHETKCRGYLSAGYEDVIKKDNVKPEH